MKRRACLVLAGGLAAALLFAPRVLAGANPVGAAAPTQPAGAARPSSAAPLIVPEDLADPGFARYVDLEQLTTAWQDLDPVAMADVGLRMADGERVLLRPGKTLAARDVLRLAVKMAVDKRDARTLERLAKAADSLGDPELAAQVQAARKLAAESRAADKPLLLSAEETTPESLAGFRMAERAIRQAALLGDAARLREIDQSLAGIEEVQGPPKVRLKQMIEAASEAAPRDVAPPPILRKLGAGSRDFWSNLVNGASNTINTAEGQGYYDVHVVNNTVRPVWVAVRYKLRPIGQEDPPFATQGWWRLGAGEQAYAVDTQNRYIYFYAYDDRGRKWTGDLKVRIWDKEMNPIGGIDYLYKQTAGFFRVDMGQKFCSYPLSLDY